MFLLSPAQGYHGPFPAQVGLNKMSGLFENVSWYITEVTSTTLLHTMIKYIPGTQETFDGIMVCRLCKLQFFPDHFKTQGMCDKAMREGPYALKFVSDSFMMQEMCDAAVDMEPRSLALVPECFKNSRDVQSGSGPQLIHAYSFPRSI